MHMYPSETPAGLSRLYSKSTRVYNVMTNDIHNDNDNNNNDDNNNENDNNENDNENDHENDDNNRRAWPPTIPTSLPGF